MACGNEVGRRLWGVVGVKFGHPPARCARVPLRCAKGGSWCGTGGNFGRPLRVALGLHVSSSRSEGEVSLPSPWRGSMLDVTRGSFYDRRRPGARSMAMRTRGVPPMALIIRVISLPIRAERVPPKVQPRGKRPMPMA